MDVGTSAGEQETLASWGRILIGVFKIVGLGSFFWQLYDEALPADWGRQEITFRMFLTIFYAYPVFLYFNFSGYTDIAIGAGRLFGFQLPENFNCLTLPATSSISGIAGTSV